MIVRYCDCCGVEIDDDNRINAASHRLQGEIEKAGKVLLRVEAITGGNDTWNKGDFCKYCVIDAINSADDRK